MSDDTTPPQPPEDLPEDVVATLRELDGHDLREAITYARELLGARHDATLQIEPRSGEEIVRVVEHPGYSEVHKRQPCGNDCEGCPHGPYVYHVTEERHSDGSERLHWEFIGRANPSP